MITIHEPEHPSVDDRYAVWTNPELWPDRCGRCIGIHADRNEAIRQGIAELEADIAMLKEKLEPK